MSFRSLSDRYILVGHGEAETGFVVDVNIIAGRSHAELRYIRVVVNIVCVRHHIYGFALIGFGDDVMVRKVVTFGACHAAGNGDTMLDGLLHLNGDASYGIIKATPHNSKRTACLNIIPSACPKNLGKATGFRGRQRSYAKFNATDVKAFY